MPLDGIGTVAHGVDRPLEGLARYAKLTGPIIDLIILAHRDPRIVLRRAHVLIVFHMFSPSKRENATSGRALQKQLETVLSPQGLL